MHIIIADFCEKYFYFLKILLQYSHHRAIIIMVNYYIVY